MKSHHPLLAVLFLMPLIWSTAPPASAVPEGWALVFSDEFDGTELDQSKWGTTMEYVGTAGRRFHNPYYLSYTLDDEVRLKDGLLQLRTDRRSIEGDEPKGSYFFTQGMVSGHDRFVFTYGYIEIRAKFPGGKGMWPCFWLMAQEHTWPPEVDIAEYYGGQRKMHHGIAHGTMHDPLWDSTGDSETQFEDTWRTFAFEWSPGRAVWFVDGEVRKITEADHVPSVPMYVVLSNSVGSKVGPSSEPDEKTIFPNSFDIDYVRIYQAPPDVLTGPVVAVSNVVTVPEKPEVVTELP